MLDLGALISGFVPPFAMAGLALSRDGAVPAFHIATAPELACRPDTLWRSASMSKLLTGRVVRAALVAGSTPPYADAPAEALLGWPLRHPAAPDRPVTVGQLASHTSGLSDAGGYLIPPVANLRDWIADNAVWSGPPGTFDYCNLGYILLAAVAEGLTGQTFDSLANKELSVLGIMGGFNWAGVADRSDRIATFRRNGDRLIPQIDATVGPQGISGPDGTEVTRGSHPGVFSPQGGLRLSLRGALRLAQAIDPEPPLWQGDGICQGYGWGVMQLDRPDLYPRPLIGHFANAYGMCGGLWRDPATGFCFAYVLNGLPLGDEADTLRPEELAILAAMAESAA